MLLEELLAFVGPMPVKLHNDEIPPSIRISSGDNQAQLDPPIHGNLLSIIGRHRIDIEIYDSLLTFRLVFLNVDTIEVPVHPRRYVEMDLGRPVARYRERQLTDVFAICSSGLVQQPHLLDKYLHFLGGIFAFLVTNP
jgi:hypothetical protein